MKFLFALFIYLGGAQLVRATVYPIPDLGVAVDVPSDLSLDSSNKWGSLFVRDNKIKVIRIHEKPNLTKPDEAIGEMLDARRKKPGSRSNDILSIRLVKTNSGLPGIAVQAGTSLSLNSLSTNVVHYFFKSPKGPVFCYCIYASRNLKTIREFDDLVLPRLSILASNAAEQGAAANP